MLELSIKDICEKIWDLEEKYELLDKEVQGVKIWQSLRMVIYYEITKQLGVFSQPHTTINNIYDKFKLLPKYLINSIIHNPLSYNYEKDILIFEHERKVWVESEYIDIYTRYLQKSLDKKDFDVMEEAYLGKHYTKKESNRKYMDALQLYKLLWKEISKVRFTDEEEKFIYSLQEELNNYFRINLDLIKMFQRNIKSFKAKYEFYCKLFKKRKPSKIFLVVSYVRAQLIAAAKDNGIRVIELQHGVISPYHLGYNFPNRKKELSYFPDEFYSFGDYWREVVQMPIDKSQIITYGFPYMDKKLSKYKGYNKISKQILFISQGVIGEELANFAYNVSKELKDYKIIFKLHPGEYARWQNDYKELLEANKLENFIVVDNNEKDLYEYFAESEYQVGVFSTAIYEGLALGCKTILVNLPGIDYMKYLKEKNIVKIVYNTYEFREVVNNFKVNKFDEKYFFKLNDKDN